MKEWFCIKCVLKSLVFQKLPIQQQLLSNQSFNSNHFGDLNLNLGTLNGFSTNWNILFQIKDF